MWKGRVILHVDMNAYFASVEQKSNPLLRGKPVVVVGDMSRRSVILTASYEARPYGIKTGMLLHEARALCPNVVPVEGDQRKCLDASEEILKILLSFTDRVEMASCDEAYLDMSDSRTRGVNAEAVGGVVHEGVKDELGLPCSIGVAPNKLLAKLASDMKKPNGITVISPDSAGAVLETTPIEDLCGIGDKLQAHLNRMGIRTCAELGRTDLETLYTRFGAWGYWLKRMGQGKDDSLVLTPDDPEVVKSVGHSTTFPKNTWDPGIVKSYLLMMCEKVGRRLRKGRLKGRVVHLTIRYSDFNFRSMQTTTREHTNDDVEIYRLGEKVLGWMGKFPKAVRLVGISVSQLVRDWSQGLLLDTFEKKRRMAKAMDELNQKYGSLTIRHAAVDTAKKLGFFEPPIPPHRHVF